GRSVRCERRNVRGIVAERHDLFIVLLIFLRDGARDHREIIEMAAEHSTRAWFRRVSSDIASERGGDHQQGKHSLHKNLHLGDIENFTRSRTTKGAVWPAYFLAAGFGDSKRISLSIS